MPRQREIGDRLAGLELFGLGAKLGLAPREIEHQLRGGGGVGDRQIVETIFLHLSVFSFHPQRCLDLVAGTHLVERRVVLDVKRHRHGLHETGNRPVMNGHLVGVFINLLDLAGQLVFHYAGLAGRRRLRLGRGTNRARMASEYWCAGRPIGYSQSRSSPESPRRGPIRSAAATRSASVSWDFPSGQRF